MSEPLGAYLKRERELRRISLSELSEQTRIKSEYLEAIEADRFEKIPGMTFARGYLKAYASYVGLNPEEVLLRFEGLLNKLSGPDLAPPEHPSHTIFWLVAFFILILSAAGIILWLHR